ncbi:MAG: UDP-2,4-diacetamido-2,4,6-trideoxy-beta-L-altropyranose hydrolase [Cyanobacteriota bacterium]|nr:UDP-2,4-diacetamido-2,4,6-trideoxy-beta-L-altropyranose hydrolase [Cyanobacteriota bacterium]
MKILIRVDASTQIGTGHVMRCLALAQAVQGEGGEAIFALATHPANLESRLKAEGMKVVHLPVEPGSIGDASETSGLAQSCACEWVVVDGYHFQEEYQHTIKDAELNLLFIDDYGHAKHYHADIVLNQNIYAHEKLYQNREFYTKLLLGTKYALFRREFWQWQGWAREIPPVARKILVTLGGADPDNVTLKVIQALQKVTVEGLEVVVVVGGSNPHYERLKTSVEKSEVSIELRQNVVNMPELMAWADIAIAGGGSTSWELSFIGLPSIIIILAEHQAENVNHLTQIGACLSVNCQDGLSVEEIAKLITILSKSSTKREKISKNSQKSFDSFGANRGLDELRKISQSNSPTIH